MQTQINDYSTFRTELAAMADDQYRDFIMRGIPSERPFIGVRLPQIRRIIKNIPLEKYAQFLGITPVAFEEVVARGMLIARLSYVEMLQYFDSQVHYIDDWCACDTFCSELKPIIKSHLSEFLDAKLDPLLNAKDEYAVRVGLVILKCNYLAPDYLAVIFDRVENLASRDEYYIKMALAWLVAECFIKYPDPTLAYLRVSHLPKWTFNKTISKICDSYRVDINTKSSLKKLRKA